MNFTQWGLEPGPLLMGSLVTLGLTAVSIALGQVVGLGLALLRRQQWPLFGALLAAYISVLRATPLLTLALAVFFITPALGYDISAPAAAVLAMTLNTSAFNCEIWRGGFAQFPRDQLDAAKAGGMGAALRLRRIVLPQVGRQVLPLLVNEMTILIKNSPAVAVIGIVELTRTAVRIGANTYRPLPPLIAALLLYIVIIWLVVAAQRYLERHYKARLA
ncbi:amino acid ABC transporter permease [Pseudomonas gingeri NCPPB 3146 = LMG 5327]|uniref:Amino acid ABC transporter permease n=2 Tax=Pseudomonas gingeri TaxID=117681 RepID=A0A7Y7XXR0_9PSED|nr:amino acid ABC transporter permease [Pseudomonas gingeri]NWC13298.1 amino acid ABC transporter permease [Pseudomonas gingeri]PNQ89745.1 amino acid ABC transporter permease [Pseudomonas gingeri NCPPB 3146 = LMG 5327]